MMWKGCTGGRRPAARSRRTSPSSRTNIAARSRHSHTHCTAPALRELGCPIAIAPAEDCQNFMTNSPKYQFKLCRLTLNA